MKFCLSQVAENFREPEARLLLEYERRLLFKIAWECTHEIVKIYYESYR